jgi:signal transduction histidine kinase
MNDTMAAFAALHSREAALRRVATLVARGVHPDEIFDAVVAEMRELLGADAARLLRYETDDTVTVVAADDPGIEIAVGTHLKLDGDSLATLVRHTARPMRMEYAGAHGSIAALMREQGIHSSVGAPILVEGRLWGMMVTVWKEPEAISNATEARMAQFTELVATAIANAHSSAQLTASRARVVAAGDETRRRIERDLHDGVQQRLVSLGLALRSAEAELPAGFPEIQSNIDQVIQGLTGTLDELRTISRGIHPAILSVGGLTPALRTLARRSPIPVELALAEGVRMPDQLEVAAYYVVAESLTNAAKHAHASVVHVELSTDGSTVELVIRDDGIGGADPRGGSGLIGLADRVEAVGGRLRVTSQRRGGTSVVATFPVREESPAARLGFSEARP